MKYEKYVFLLLLSFITAITLMNCGQEEPPPPTTIQPLDKTRVQSIKAAFNNDPTLAPENLQVEVSNDTAKLTGTVHSEEDKLKAGELASKTRGINTVINNIEVLKKE